MSKYYDNYINHFEDLAHLLRLVKHMCGRLDEVRTVNESTQQTFDRVMEFFLNLHYPGRMPQQNFFTARREACAATARSFLQSMEGVKLESAGGKRDDSTELEMLRQRVKDFEDDYKLVMEERCGDDRQHCTCVPSLRAAIKEAREEVFDLYHQACLVHPNSSDDPIQEFQYDNQCMSTYESIEDKLIEWGMLKAEQCLRRKK